MDDADQASAAHRAPPRRAPRPDELAPRLIAGDRAALGRAISLVESTRTADEPLAADLLARVLPRTGSALRVGITGVPGAGKSTFIECLGVALTARGHRVAVLAVDPSSGVSGGSILGDKTRMARLGVDPSAFIRPSPSGGTLGGVARRTRETLLLCEAAGYDVVLVETVGVGQSETAVANMTDFFIAVMIPGAGDELQGIKRGLLEVVDLLVINKADGDNVSRARDAARSYASVLGLIARRDPTWEVPVLPCSAKTGEGVTAAWDKAQARLAALRASGELLARRREQEMRWLDELIREGVMSAVTSSTAGQAALARARVRVAEGHVPVAAAAREVVESLLRPAR